MIKYQVLCWGCYIFVLFSSSQPTQKTNYHLHLKDEEVEV